jgi:Tol biopolymer transport system component
MKPVLVLACIMATILMFTVPVFAAGTMLLQYGFSPGWMPDGSSIVCAQYNAVDDEHTAIVAVSPSGGQPDTLIRDAGAAYFPMPLSDGHHIVYYHVQEIPTYTQEFVIHDLDGGPAVVWPASGAWDDYGFTLSPDESEVLYTTGAGETWALDLGDGSTRFVCDGFSGSISPDGQWVAYGLETAEAASIAVAPVDGGAAVLVASGWWPRWSPDGEYIVFSGVVADGGEFVADICVVSRDGSRTECLTDDLEWDYQLAVSPLGDKVAFVKTPGEFERHDLWVVDVDFGSISTQGTTWGRVKQIFR